MANAGVNTMTYTKIKALSVNKGIKPQWVIQGKAYTLTDFATTLFGDTPQRTEFLLRYGEGHD